MVADGIGRAGRRRVRPLRRRETRGDPLDGLAEYCEVLIRLDKSTAAATIVLIDD